MGKDTQKSQNLFKQSQPARSAALKAQRQG